MTSMGWVSTVAKIPAHAPAPILHTALYLLQLLSNGNLCTVRISEEDTHDKCMGTSTHMDTPLYLQKVIDVYICGATGQHEDIYISLVPSSLVPRLLRQKAGEEPGNEASSQAVPTANVVQILAVETNQYAATYGYYRYMAILTSLHSATYKGVQLQLLTAGTVTSRQLLTQKMLLTLARLE